MVNCTQIIARTGGDASAISCAMSADELKVFGAQIPSSTFVSFDSRSALLIIRNGVNGFMGPAGSSTSAQLLKEMNRLMYNFAPPTFWDDARQNPSMQAIFNVEGNIASNVPMLCAFQRRLHSRFCDGQTRELLQCHIGRSVVLRMFGKDFGLDNGDVYLVSGPVAAKITQSQ